MELDFLPIPLTWVLLAVLPVLFYLYAVRPIRLFKNMGVPGRTPLPLLGNVHHMIKAGFYNPEAQLEGITTYGNVMGSYAGASPILSISDPEMLREIFIKQFHKFANRSPDKMTLNTKPQGRMLTQLVDDDWKNVRTTLSPAFSGGKLKKMTEAMNSCADLLVENIGKFVKRDESFDTKELTGGFTMDVIARTAFGLEVDSQRNPQDPFVVNSKKAFSFNFLSPLFWLFFMFPSIMKPILERFDYNFMDNGVQKFFNEVVDQVLGMRQNEDKGHGRVDFMQLMVDAHKTVDDEEESEETKVYGTKKPLTKDDIVANGFIFFVAGYETTATTMAFALYNLAVNQEAQDKARQEIIQVMEGKELVDYEAVHQMPYLDMCVNETLRLYSPAASLSRVASEDVKLKWLTIKKDMLVMVPILGIHHDPKRWPEPKKFIPERFTKEEREKRNPYDWLPFGAGPRNCIGMRLALMEVKVGLAKILMKNRIVTGPKTDIPLKLNKYKPFPTPEKGIQLKAEPLAPGST